MVDAKCDHVVETALKLIYIVFVKKDLERGSKCDKRKNWKFCKKIDAKSIKRNYEKCWGFRECSFENVLYTSVVLSTRQRIKLLMINF